MNFKAGDHVRFLDEEGQAIVKSVIDSKTVLIEDETGFDYEIDAAKLVKTASPDEENGKYEQVQPDIRNVLERNLDESAAKKASDDFKVKYKRPTASPKRKGEFMEVDLHIHEIREQSSGMSNSEIVQIQMDHFNRMMRMAKQKRLDRIIFIHGVGKGVLRMEIRNALANYFPECTFHDAPYTEYGYGATEVILRKV
ncbi:Smr/MutS family protein [Halocola ammonii]